MENKKEKNQKGKNIIIFVLCGIIVVLMIALAVVLLQGTSKEEPTSPNVEPSKSPESAFIELDTEGKVVQEAYSIIPTRICGGIAFSLPDNKISIDDLSNNEKFNLLLSIYKEDIIFASEDNPFVLDENELSRYFEDVSFMEEYKKGVDSLDHPGYKLIFPIKMEYQDGKYTFQAYGMGCEAPYPDGNYIKLISAKKNNKELVLTITSYYQKASSQNPEQPDYKFYKKEGDTTEVDIKDVEKLEKYEITYSIENSKLQFQEIKHIS